MSNFSHRMASGTFHFSGTAVALLTPFTPNLEVEAEKMYRHAEMLVNNGATALALMGLNGEGPSLSEQHIQDIAGVMARFKESYGKVKLIFTLMCDERDDYMRKLDLLNPDILDCLMVAPMLRGDSPKHFLQTMKQMSNAIDADLIAYNTGASNMAMNIEYLEQLHEETSGRLIGVKSSRDSSALLEEYVNEAEVTASGLPFAFYQGNDRVLLQSIRELSRLNFMQRYNYEIANISGAANLPVFLKYAKAIYEAEAGRQSEKADRLQAAMNEFLKESLESLAEHITLADGPPCRAEPAIWKAMAFNMGECSVLPPLVNAEREAEILNHLARSANHRCCLLSRQEQKHNYAILKGTP